MKAVILPIAVALLAGAALPSAARAQPPAQLEESRAAVAATDFDRLFRDRAYAAQILVHVDRLAAAAGDDLDRALWLDNLRALILAVLERNEDAGIMIDRILEARPTNPRFYAGAWYASQRMADHRRSAAVIEQASRNVAGRGWAGLRELFGRETVWRVMQGLEEADDQDTKARMAEALLRIGWPAPDEGEAADGLRARLVTYRVARGDRAGAIEAASGLTAPLPILQLVVQRKYDGVFAGGPDPLARFNAALERRDLRTAEALAATPSNVRRLLDRAQFLRTVGRDAEALALLEPSTRDLRATVAADDLGMWLINEAVYALLSLGRRQDAAALMGRLVGLPIAEHPELISASINYAEVLWEVGRFEDSLAHARLLERDAASNASEYGKMWIRSAIVCALASLDRAAEAAPTLTLMRANSERNQAALMRAYLCLNDMAAAEALMIARLESDDPVDAVLALQDYQLAGPAAGADPLEERLRALAARPAVRAALERIGRVLPLPIARTYYGDI